MREKTGKTVGVACALLLSAIAAAPAAEEPEIDPSGYLYGSVETDSDNTYRGFLRWGREEAFWDDLFNSGKLELPYADVRPEEERESSEVRIFGVRIRWGREDEDRQFVARFGDIREIEPIRRDRVRVTMRDGGVYELDDSSNDVGADIRVADPALGEIVVEWGRIVRVRFAPAPDDAVPAARRLQGTVRTEAGSFEGYVQWDLEECLATDELDGETRDGDLSIEMGHIRAIEKNDRHGAWVELDDGRRLLLEDTNDVDHSTSGIFVEDARFGRVKIGWDEFERVDFAVSGASGRGYGEYPEIRPLSGRVVGEDGEVLAGEIVFDLDERRSWEMLDGRREEIDYSIPFALVRTIEPLGRDRARITLTTGETLVLEDTQDVSDENDGVVVLAGEERRERWMAWRDVERIEFDRAVGSAHR